MCPAPDSAYCKHRNKVTLPVSSTETGLGGTLIDTATWSGSPINVLAYGTIWRRGSLFVDPGHKDYIIWRFQVEL